MELASEQLRGGEQRLIVVVLSKRLVSQNHQQNNMEAIKINGLLIQDVPEGRQNNIENLIFASDSISRDTKQPAINGLFFAFQFN